MEILLNRCYGGFNFSNDFLKEYPQYDRWSADRTDPNLIADVRAFGIEKASGMSSRFSILCLPETLTDWTIVDYDGAESVYYVVDGKIHID